MLSKNIKTLRMQKGITQKELAEKLHVTSQAVSRWEQGDVEPSIDTISNMAKLFEVTTDELIGELKVKVAEEKPEEEKEEKKEEKVTKESAKPVLAVCENCNEPIYEGKNIIRKTITNGDGTTGFKVICNNCHKKDEEAKLDEQKRYGVSQRIKSFVWGGIIAAIILASGIVYLTSPLSESGDIIMVLLLSISAFTFSSCLFLKNNFIEDKFLDIASWGFVTFPGLIFDLSFDGIIWLIGMKIIFWLLGFVLGFLATLLALFVSLALSLFAYPFAIVRSFRHPEMTEKDI